MKRIACLVLFLIGLTFAAVAARATDSDSQLVDRSRLQCSTGTATINSATADYSSWQPILTIAPDPNSGAFDGKVVIDLHKASTGFAAVYTSGTITFTIARKVDGTNWRPATNLATTAISGTNASGLGIELNLGVIGPNESVRIYAKISSVSNTNVALPYVVYYRSGVRATFTAAS